MSTNRRKRARVDATPGSVDPEIPVEPQAIRDGDYYFDDGDFIIRAENTLFRVHKFLLSRDSSMFKDMFIIPGGSATTETADGSTDETPLAVSDTVESFRALLWVLYALPLDLHALANEKTTTHLNRMLFVAEITNKYHFTSLEAWSMQLIKAVVPKVKFTEATSPLLARTMILAERCADSALSDVVLAAWEGLLQGGVNPAQFISVLEREEHSSFGALTYYTQLSSMKLVHAGDPGSCTFTLTGCDGLSEKQISKLLFARWALQTEFFHLCANAPPLPRGADCPAATHHTDVCTRDWNKIWLECMTSKTVLTIDSADLLGRLNGAQKYIANVRRVQMHSTCRPKMEVAVVTLIKMTKRHLGDHFQLPTLQVGLSNEMSPELTEKHCLPICGGRSFNFIFISF
ncbi:hypothetical protein B0H14DRAFT_3640493 [Mycena olivaceomarginata]|nr:hypothetical protein B0H14DRAFT_3640493 [Mycena olivaceomarginata]